MIQSSTSASPLNVVLGLKAVVEVNYGLEARSSQHFSLALPRKIASFRLNAKCCFANRHRKHITFILSLGHS